MIGTNVHQLKLKIRVHGRHPWFYRKMVRRPTQPIAAGSAVKVRDREGHFVGVGFYNPRTDLALRMLTREDVADAEQTLIQRVDTALRWRRDGLGLGRDDDLDGYRLIHAEGDGLPGLIVDRLGDAIVAQVFSLCVMQRIESIGEALQRTFPQARFVLTADDRARKLEGFDAPARGQRFETTVTEHGIRYLVRPGQDHKTGFFADQRENRLAVRELARGRKSVLDLCCNSGGFALNAAAGGAAKVLGVDLDEHAVARAQKVAKSNDLRCRFEHGDAFDVLRDAKDGTHDLIVLDPPKWIMGKDLIEVGSQRYRDLNELAFRKIAKGGLLVTCSCSGALSESRFFAIVAEAAAAAGRDARALRIAGAGSDHPVALECPQTRYLKTMIFVVD